MRAMVYRALMSDYNVRRPAVASNAASPVPAGPEDTRTASARLIPGSSINTELPSE